MNMHAQQQAAISGTTEVGEVTASEQNGQVQISIAIGGPAVRPRISRLADPDRLVLNFPGAIPKLGQTRTHVSKGLVSAVRTALFETDENGHPVTRVVIDLTKRADFQTSSEPGKFIVNIGDPQPRTAAAPAAAPPVATPAPRPASAPAAVRSAVSAGPNTLNGIELSHAGGSTTISLKFREGARPRTLSINGPKRFVMDFPGVVFGADWMQPPTLSVNSAAVSAIRSSLFREDPPVLRVVLDQVNGSQAPKVSIDGNNVLVQFPDQVAASIQPQPARPAVSKNISHTRVTRAVARESEPPPPHHSLTTPQNASAADTITPTSASMKPETRVGPMASRQIVRYDNGLLSVDAENAVLVDVLYAVGEKTGAAIEVPMSQAMLDRVVLKIGPKRPREVISTMLEGSGFNYFIIENNLGNLEKIVLTPKEAEMPQAQ